MGVFSKTDVDSDIYKLKLREKFIETAKREAGETFVGIVWDNPDDPFCCSGTVLRKIKININMNVVYAPYISSVFLKNVSVTDNH